MTTIDEAIQAVQQVLAEKKGNEYVAYEAEGIFRSLSREDQSNLPHAALSGISFFSYEHIELANASAEDDRILHGAANLIGLALSRVT